MNHHSDDICRFCGSDLNVRFGTPHCTGNNLADTRSIFDEALALEKLDPSSFNSRLETLRENECTFDLFMDYWERKKKDSGAGIKCIHKERYFRDLEPQDLDELPMPDPYIPFPDLVEVYIAEIMLDRELTDLEKEGSCHIPKIRQENGSIYFAALTWVVFPHSYMSTSKGEGKIESLEPLDKVFDIEAIRGRFSDRKGDSIDD